MLCGGWRQGLGGERVREGKEKEEKGEGEKKGREGKEKRKKKKPSCKQKEGVVESKLYRDRFA